MRPRPLFSPMWYRVAQLRPRIRAHAQFHRQHYRGDLWYVLQDHVSGRFYRFSPEAYALIGLMDGQRTVQEIWDAAGEHLGDALPTQDDVLQLMAQLHAADLLAADSMPDVEEIAERSATQKRRKFWSAVRNPLGIRIPLIDPDSFLSATSTLVRPLFGWLGALLWLAVVSYGAVLAGVHWTALTQNAFDQALSAHNIVLLAASYVVVKALHELGHGYAVKVWGGEVHDLGLMLIVFMPVPYVDATASSAFASKWRRMTVGAAGILVELFLAAGAMIVWVELEPGFLRALAFNVMLIGGVSTLLFNGNPLLRFDGYYVLCDLIEIPNLAARANRYFFYLVRHHVFGLASAESPATGEGERRWLLGYALAAFVYRMMITLGIVLLIAGKFFFIGVVLALWAGASFLVTPVAKGLRYLFTAGELDGRRGRALAASIGIFTIVAVAFGAVPLPSGTVAEGVVWVPENGRVHAGASGFVDGLLAMPGQPVRAGQPLVAMADPILVAEAAVLRAELHEHRVRLTAEEITDRVAAEVTREKVTATTTKLARLEERLAALAVTSPMVGRFVPRDGEDLVGRYLRKGDLLGYVLDFERPSLRVVVHQEDIDRVRSATDAIEVRLAHAPLEVHPARILRATPQATNRLPAPALGTSGGGSLPLDPADPRGETSLEHVFIVDLEPLEPLGTIAYGTRIHARFDHGAEPLATQIHRAVRQLLLRRFEL